MKALDPDGGIDWQYAVGGCADMVAVRVDSNVWNTASSYLWLLEAAASSLRNRCEDEEPV